MDFAYDERTEELRARLTEFMNSHVYPSEADFEPIDPTQPHSWERPPVMARLKERRRTLAGRSGCGLCGIESLAQALPRIDGSVVPFALDIDALSRALADMRGQQALQSATGATHAAAWCSPAGRVQVLREDVGRHNALDKLIGALALARRDATEGFFAVTSRASYEMVQKTVRARVGALAAISAPTALAVRCAEQAGLCLIGFARGVDWVAYSATERLILESPR